MKRVKREPSRRDFLKQSTAAGVGILIASNGQIARGYPANEQLNIASVGAGGRAASDIEAAVGGSEKVVALCDVDEERAQKMFSKYPDVPKYRDYRVMLEKEAKNIDAVIVATPDHNHAPASIRAMRLGKHVYCEKPLTHNIYEARLMAKTAAEAKVATQMGNQGTAAPGFRTNVEIIQSGAIGKIREIHLWTNRPIWPQGVDALLGHEGVQASLHGGETPQLRDTVAWDLWLGPAPFRPYDPVYAPFKWRGWWDFGTGALGDMGCHTMNLAFMALKLGAPRSVEAEVSVYNPETAPEWSVIRYEFPARGELPPVRLTWYEGGKMPPDDVLSSLSRQRLLNSGCLLIGDKGKLYSPDDYGTEYHLLPEREFRDYEPPAPTLERSPGHHQEWVRACRGGSPATSNFVDYAGALTETALLGVVASRVGRRIFWDAENMRVLHNPNAAQFLKREYRKGWEL